MTHAAHARAVRPALVTLALLSISACAANRTQPEPIGPVRLHDAAGREVGWATLRQTDEGVRVALEVRGLAPGVHGVHVHAVGRCEPPGFESAGGHFNPSGRQHGLSNPAGPHVGDLPNLTVDANGAGSLSHETSQLTLRPGPTSMYDADGSALVVHAQADDGVTDPSGNSGARVACGVIAAPGSGAR